MSKKYPPWMEPRDYRDGEQQGDYIAWMFANSPSNEEQLDRAKRNLLRAFEEELTETQKEVIKQKFFHDKSVTEIAIERGVNKSTVSRTIKRALQRLKRCVKYSF